MFYYYLPFLLLLFGIIIGWSIAASRKVPEELDEREVVAISYLLKYTIDDVRMLHRNDVKLPEELAKHYDNWHQVEVFIERVKIRLNWLYKL